MNTIPFSGTRVPHRPGRPDEPSTVHRVPDHDFDGSHAGRRFRRPLLASVAAIGLVMSVGGAAVADPGFARFLGSPLGVAAAGHTNVADSVADALVDIVTTNTYTGSQAAGTGMVLTTSGEILTNNHVVEGSTSIKVTVVATGATYSASVVGTDPGDDVAVIQLAGASGLETLPIGDSRDVEVGDAVVASGNAGGEGGDPSVVTGTVTALDQSITASDENGSNAEKLSGLIQTDAPIVAGDSGGALATSDGEVIGMNTAAAVSNSTNLLQGNGQAAASEAYAIPIRTALSIAGRIEDGETSSVIHLGTTGFLGIELPGSAGTATQGTGFTSPWGDVPIGGSGGAAGGTTGSVSGVTVAGVVAGGPADDAGLSAGDVITSVGGTPVADAAALSGVLAKTSGGQQVTVGWTGSDGQSHSASVTLADAPAV